MISFLLSTSTGRSRLLSDVSGPATKDSAMASKKSGKGNPKPKGGFDSVPRALPGMTQPSAFTGRHLKVDWLSLSYFIVANCSVRGWFSRRSGVGGGYKETSS